MSEALEHLRVKAASVSAQEPFPGCVDMFVQTIAIISASPKPDSGISRMFQQASKDVVSQELDDLRHCASALALCIKNLHETTRQCLWDAPAFAHNGATALMDWNYVFRNLPAELALIIDGARRANKDNLPNSVPKGRPVENRVGLAAKITAKFYHEMTGNLPNKSKKATGFLPVLQAVFNLMGSDANVKAAVDTLLKVSR